MKHSLTNEVLKILHKRGRLHDRFKGGELPEPNVSLIRTSQGDTVYGNPVEFYLYHSSDCSIEKVTAPTYLGPGVDFDITSIVKPGYFYGGVATDYGGKGTVATAIENGDFSMFDGVTSVSDDGESYDGSSLTTESKTRFWTKATLFGSRFVPEKNKIYYIKEVPKDLFLLCYMGVVYDTNTNHVTLAALLSIVDDTYYTSVEHETSLVSNETEKCRIASSYSYSSGGKVIAKFAAKDINNVRGYVCASQLSTIFPPETGGADFTFGFTLTTLDGVKVHRSKRIWTEDWQMDNTHAEYIDDISYSYVD